MDNKALNRQNYSIEKVKDMVDISIHSDLVVNIENNEINLDNVNIFINFLKDKIKQHPEAISITLDFGVVKKMDSFAILGFIHLRENLDSQGKILNYKNISSNIDSIIQILKLKDQFYNSKLMPAAHI